MVPRQTVYLVDDDSAVSQSVRMLLKSVSLPCQVFETAAAFLDAYAPSWQGCLVVDVRMPGMSGLELLELFPVRGIYLPAIMITGHADVAMAIRAMKLGVIEFLEKPFNPQALLESIHRAFAQDVAARRQRQHRAEIKTRLALLTPREREVFNLIVTGMENKTIATQLGISRKTLDVHRAKVMQKLQAASVADLVRQEMTLKQNDL